MRHRIAVGLLLAGTVAAVGLPGSASASNDITQNAVGTYEYHYKGNTAIWDVAECDDNADNCIKVTQFGAKDTGRTKPVWSTNAYWLVGSWSMVIDTPNQAVCEDGAKYSLPVTYAWDAATNSGWRSWFNPGLCGDEPASSAFQFQLTKV